MRRALLCVPNVSEGRDAAVLEALVAAVRGVPGVRLLHRSADPDHNRAVLAYLGEPEDVLASTRALAADAFERVDMRSHRGRHPRVGAVDVVPFVPVRGVSTSEALDVCRRFGRWVGEHGVPVYYYEEAATRPERRRLPDLRRGGYEALPERLADPAWAPDEGPARFHERAGAVITGVRGPLVAFNVNLRTDDLAVAQRIAREVRESGGGLPHVRAIAVPLLDRGLVQVSMNLTRPERTPISRALAAVRERAEQEGVAVAGTEIVGPIPADALVEAARDCLAAADLHASQIVELALLDE